MVDDLSDLAYAARSKAPEMFGHPPLVDAIVKGSSNRTLGQLARVNRGYRLAATREARARVRARLRSPACPLSPAQFTELVRKFSERLPNVTQSRFPGDQGKMAWSRLLNGPSSLSSLFDHSLPVRNLADLRTFIEQHFDSGTFDAVIDDFSVLDFLEVGLLA